MRRLAAALAALAMLAMAVPAFAQVTFADGWMRPAAKGAASVDAYVDVTVGDALTLVGVSTPIAKSVAMVAGHVEGTTYQSHVVTHFALPARETFRFARYANVLRLQNLARDVSPGDTVRLTFTFRDHAKRLRKASADLQVRGVVNPARRSP
jgi:copper(I)-binding protein